MEAICGTCGGKHATILDYRECAGIEAEAVVAGKVMDNVAGEDRTINPPSEAQIKYVMDLLSTHTWPDEYTPASLRAMERRQVSQLIESVKATPLREGATEDPKLFDDIPEGRYALEKPNGQGWTFWEVQKPTRGKWRGYTFVKQLIGSPGDYRQQKVGRALGHNVLEEIERLGARVASAAFGQQSETCGVCHSPLTNDESIKYGIGPHCRSKMGW
jgi:hypothetical protein